MLPDPDWPIVMPVLVDHCVAEPLEPVKICPIRSGGPGATARCPRALGGGRKKLLFAT
jgi:hypothetical protein